MKVTEKGWVKTIKQTIVPPVPNVCCLKKPPLFNIMSAVRYTVWLQLQDYSN